MGIRRGIRQFGKSNVVVFSQVFLLKGNQEYYVKYFNKNIIKINRVRNINFLTEITACDRVLGVFVRENKKKNSLLNSIGIYYNYYNSSCYVYNVFGIYTSSVLPLVPPLLLLGRVDQRHY